jgi:hypothetical protein
VPVEAHAADPNPANASLLGATATLFPIAVGSGLLLTGRGQDEGVRLASALTSIGLGAAVGPSAGQLYAGAGVDGVVTLVFRSLTTGLTTTGLALAFRGSEEEEPAAFALIAVGGLTTAALAVFDIVDAADTAREARVRGAARRAEARALASILACGPIPCATGP